MGGTIDEAVDFPSPELPFDDPLSESWERLWRRLASGAALLSAVVLLALVVIVARSNQARDEALTRERHSYETMLVTSALSDQLATTEAALGHFVVSGERTVGATASDHWALAGSLIDRLDDMTADNRIEHQIIGEIRSLYQKRGKEFGDPALRAYFKQGYPALNLFNAAGHTATGPRITKLLKQLTASERANLGQRESQAEALVAHSNHMAEWLSVLGLFVVLGGALMGVTTFQATAQRHIARRKLRTANERADTLEARVTERTLDLERANAALRAEAAERAAAEAQLRQIQKMEAVGQLTGGIAHDFNNMLAVVVGGLDLARKRLANETDEIGRHIESAMEGANRAAALTRRLLAFARSEPLLPEPIEPGRLLSGMNDLLDRTLGERIEVVLDAADNLWTLWIDRHQLENAILNLAVNSRDAMNGEGTLRISAANHYLRGGEIGDAKAGDYVRISVSDSGCGIPPEVIERVFEPFFTTKPVGKGTGLGLSQIFAFAQQSGGEIAIESRQGQGTTVSLYLPRHLARSGTAAAAAKVAALPVRTSDPVVTGQTILVVEDDPRVRRATVDALAELGHDPLPCTCGEDALALLAERPDIELMVTDVVMPGMTGPELVARVTPLYPHLGILYVTGYVGDVEEADQLRGHEILRKPFTVSTLEGAISATQARTFSGSRPDAGVAAAE